MTILSGGNVGIGTLTPASKLDVAGTISTTTQYNIGPDRVLRTTYGFLDADTFVGVGAGASNPPQDRNANSFFGGHAGTANVAGEFNSFFGFKSGLANINATHNAFFGAFSGRDNTSGRFNLFFGEGAASFNTSGSNNTFVGNGAGVYVNEIGTVDSTRSNRTENDNTFIGFHATGGGVTNATAIGARAHVTQSNSLVLGSINGLNNATEDTSVAEGSP